MSNDLTDEIECKCKSKSRPKDQIDPTVITHPYLLEKSYSGYEPDEEWRMTN